MTKYLELLLDLLEIENKDPYIEVSKIIETNKGKDIKVYHQHFFIFEWYKKLLDGILSPEEFLQLGDMDSALRFDLSKPDSISFLKSNPKLDPNSIYIFDSIADWILSAQKNIYYV